MLHKLPRGYTQRLKHFTGERGYLVEEHLGLFADWTDLEEVDHEDFKVRLLAQSLDGRARRWFTSLPDNSISSYQYFEEILKNRWEERKDPRKCLSNFHSIRGEESESFLEFSSRFLKVYDSIPTQLKPPPSDVQL